MRTSPIVIAIPVKNEEAHIGACLHSLRRQTMPFDRLVLLLNNCADGSGGICHRFKEGDPRVEIHEVMLSGPLSSAGEARCLALNVAGESGPDGVILTTDADAVQPHSWIEANMRAIKAGADAVCGMAEIPPVEQEKIPANLREDDRREKFLLSVLDEIAYLLVPDHADPWPRHQQQAGASIAVRSGALHQAGGPPHIASGEDRVLIERLRLIDARIRHAPDIMVSVSGRLEGRAAGGMAETIARRMIRQDKLTDAKLEPSIDAYRRKLAQARLMAVRQGQGDAAGIARDLLIDAGNMQAIMNAEFHGQAWALLQEASPVLQRRRVAFAELEREIGIARELRDKLVMHNTAGLPGLVDNV